MVTVSTKEGLRTALGNRESQILVTGELALKMRRKIKIRKKSKLGRAALVIGGIVAIPFSGGSSLCMTAAGLVAGSVAIEVEELAILCGFVICMTGVLKGARVQFSPDGTVIVEPKYNI